MLASTHGTAPFHDVEGAPQEVELRVDGHRAVVVKLTAGASADRLVRPHAVVAGQLEVR